MKKIYDTLRRYGYLDTIIYENNRLVVKDKTVSFDADALFFVDAGFRVMHTFLFAIHAPKYGVKGILSLDLPSYHTLGTTPYATKFHIEIENNPETVRIKREYGMRKVYLDTFDSKRYVLREGFEDFPACPYGHTFKKLGFDTKLKEYVRFEKAILKLPDLKKEYGR